jgi:capsule biosynthesis phosphatase
MRIVIDLDGTICPIKKSDQQYSDLKPLDEAVEKLREMRAAGHYIIIQTARNMATQQGNLGKVMQNIGKITLDWLAQYDVPYDEIYFGKPNAHLYIDDRAFRFNTWKDVTPELLNQLGKER